MIYGVLRGRPDPLTAHPILGNLILRSPDGQQADVVVYTGDDARPEDRYVRFHR